MKSIFVPYIGAFGGVERLILSLSEFLQHRSIEHRVVCFRDTINLTSHAGWPLVVEQLTPTRSSWAEAKALRRYCHSINSADLLLFDLKGAFYASLANLWDFHLHLTDPPSLLEVESSRSANVYRRWANDVSSVTLKRRAIGEAVQRINRRGVRRAKSVIAMTNCIAGELQALFGVSPQVVRPGVAKVNPKPKVKRDVITILSVSSLEKSKRIDAAIDALAELTTSQYLNGGQQNRRWQLEIAGAGPAREELELYAAKRGVASCAQFLGRVSDAELEDAYQRASLFVMPAVQGYGLPALEALMRAVPVVLHRDSGVSEILDGSPWTEIIEHTDQLATAIHNLCERIDNQQLYTSTNPSVPTDSQWAEQISQICNWTGIDPKS